jgi:hypothetical protein
VLLLLIQKIQTRNQPRRRAQLYSILAGDRTVLRMFSFSSVWCSAPTPWPCGWLLNGSGLTQPVKLGQPVTLPPASGISHTERHLNMSNLDRAASRRNPQNLSFKSDRERRIDGWCWAIAAAITGDAGWVMPPWVEPFYDRYRDRVWLRMRIAYDEGWTE